MSGDNSTETDTDRVEGAQMYLEMIDQEKYPDETAGEIERLIDDLGDLALEIELHEVHEDGE